MNPKAGVLDAPVFQRSARNQLDALHRQLLNRGVNHRTAGALVDTVDSMQKDDELINHLRKHIKRSNNQPRTGNHRPPPPPPREISTYRDDETEDDFEIVDIEVPPQRPVADTFGEAAAPLSSEDLQECWPAPPDTRDGSEQPSMVTCESPTPAQRPTHKEETAFNNNTFTEGPCANPEANIVHDYDAEGAHFAFPEEAFDGAHPRHDSGAMMSLSLGDKLMTFLQGVVSSICGQLFGISFMTVTDEERPTDCRGGSRGEGDSPSEELLVVGSLLLILCIAYSPTGAVGKSIDAVIGILGLRSK